jgi:arabinofuranan 3-O-arabinosyltransferase
VTEGVRAAQFGTRSARTSPRLLGIFSAWRLEAYGYTLAAFYAVIFFYLYKSGIWLLDGNGRPLPQNFAYFFSGGLAALHGQTAAIYDPAEFTKIQEALVGTGQALFRLWPYPPPLFLILAPLATLPYVTAFLTWILATLLGLVAVVYLIVRRRPAIALALASPFTVWNVVPGYSGFLTAALLGAALLFLESRPVVAGIFIGCLTLKPQWGILIPVALVAAGQWRAFLSAVAATALLAGASIVAFGLGPWEAFPRELFAQGGLNLSVDPSAVHSGFDPRSHWQHFQTIFGLVRVLHGGATLAWLAQGVTTIASAVVVWLVWRSPARHALKAATLSAAALLATPYAFGYDMAAIAIPIAFLARDQISHGLLKGEQVLLLAVFGVSLLFSFGPLPVEPIVVAALLGAILRRVLADGVNSIRRRRSGRTSSAVLIAHR